MMLIIYLEGKQKEDNSTEVEISKEKVIVNRVVHLNQLVFN